MTDKYYTYLPDIVLSKLEKVRATGQDKWMSCCPAHKDKSPSLSIKFTGDRILIHCFSGCLVDEICSSIGLSVSDLFSESLSNEHRRDFKREQYHKVIREEYFIIQIAKQDLHKGKPISELDNKRINLAVNRIRKAQEVLNGI